MQLVCIADRKIDGTVSGQSNNFVSHTIQFNYSAINFISILNLNSISFIIIQALAAAATVKVGIYILNTSTAVIVSSHRIFWYLQEHQITILWSHSEHRDECIILLMPVPWVLFHPHGHYTGNIPPHNDNQLVSYLSTTCFYCAFVIKISKKKTKQNERYRAYHHNGIVL